MQPGDSLLSIALRHKVRKAELASVNNIFEGTLFANQVSIQYKLISAKKIQILTQDEWFFYLINFGRF